MKISSWKLKTCILLLAFYLKVYHFSVTKRNLTTDDDSIIHALSGLKGYQTRMLNHIRSLELSFSTDSYSEKKLVEFIVDRHILDKYDFLGVSERYDESLAVLSMLLKLPVEDMIVLNAKKSGGYDATKECYLIQKAKRTPEIEKYFQSKKYTNKNPDLYLYDAVNAKLDRTIEMLGAESVQERARLIKEAQKRADEACQDSAIFPCSADGVSQREDAGKNCYFLDSGCGFQCIDDTLTTK